MHKSHSRILMAALSGLLILTGCQAKSGSTPSATSSAQETSADMGKAALTVNGEAIPQAMVDDMVKQRTAPGQPAAPDLVQSVKDDLVARTLAAQAAVNDGLNKQPDTAAQVALARETVLARAYLQNYAKTHPITDAQLQAEYNKLKQQVGDKEYKVRHILVKDPQQAQDIIKQLNNGGNFAALAKKYSIDPGSKDNGGDLDWITPNSVVKPFADAMVKLKKGEHSQQPVKTEYGYHVIELDDTRDVKAPPFDQVKPQLMQRMQQEKVVKALDDLKAKAKIVDNSPAPKADNSAAAAGSAPQADNSASK